MKHAHEHPDAVEELDSDYPENYLQCRSLQHRWGLIGYYHAGGEIVRSLMCERCGMDRHDFWSPGGVRLRNTYTQPSGYRITNGGASKHEVRREVLNRVTVYDNEDLMHAALMSGRGKSKSKAEARKATG